jgi:hypothetical protein
MGQTRYLLHGLTIGSDIELGTPLTGMAPVDVSLTRSTIEAPVGTDAPPGDLMARLTLGDAHLYSGVDNGTAYVLRIHGLCDFVVSRSLDAVTCYSVDSVEGELLSLLVRGALIAFVLGLRGDCVLHASVVETDDGSVAFVGGSGMGKSTLAALTCRDGARFVSDDLLRLNGDAPPSWVGHSSELRLRAGAAPMAESTWGARLTVDDRTAVRPTGSTASTGRIGAVVVPAPTRERPALELTRIDPFDAAFVLSAFPRLMWTSPKELATQFDGVTRLAQAVPVFRASVPWGPPFAENLGAQLLSGVLGVGVQVIPQ